MMFSLFAGFFFLRTHLLHALSGQERSPEDAARMEGYGAKVRKIYGRFLEKLIRLRYAF
jgi:hypothetical protein